MLKFDIIPATPGHFARGPNKGAMRYPVIAWHIVADGDDAFSTVSVQAITGGPTPQFMDDCKVIEFPDGHVEYRDGIYDSYEDYLDGMWRESQQSIARTTKQMGKTK